MMDETNEDSCGEAFLFPGYNDANSYSQDALRYILTATKTSNALPAAGDDFDYYSTFQGFRTVLQRKRHSILSLMTSIIQSQGVREAFHGRELEEKFDLLVDVNDVILENVSNNLDAASGVHKSEEELILAVKPQTAINTSWNKKQFKANSSESFKLLTAKNISRPQLTFKDKIDNSNSIFVPTIKEKPNSIRPLAIILEKDGDKEEFCHPYEWEIEKFSPPDELLQNVKPIVPKPVDETPLIMIKTVDQLKELCSNLKKEKEIAVDLEHHSYRSFQGFTCLMQISTRMKDYIIDVLELRSNMYILNDVFTDPKIVKVFHGADMDILWLQRDFGLYIVNLFDTGQAARVLHFAHLSLSYLLKHYCKLDLDKQFQLADWRIRPLPSEMIKYARQDTHYLLYIYDCLKNDLIKNGNEVKNLLCSTFERSKMICSKKYQKPLYSEDKYLDLYKKCKKILNAKQLYCFKELYAWRDRIARQNDESLGYVLPNHMLLQIAEALPREQQGILACCNPIPPLVKQQLNELHSIVLKANESSIKELETLEMQQRAVMHKVNDQIDLNNLIHCPHDILHLEDSKSQSASQTCNSENSLPLITKESSPSQPAKRPALTALFEQPSKKARTSVELEDKSTEKVADIISKLISPFERYKLTEQLQSSQQQKTADASSRSNSYANAHSRSSSNADTYAESNSSEVHSNSEESSVMQSTTNEKTKIQNKIVGANVQQNTSAEDSSCVNLSSESVEILTSTPLRKRSDKKRKKKIANPDISVVVTSQQSGVPPRKKHTPEVVTLDDSFKPYNYSQCDYSTFSGKNRSKGRSSETSQESIQISGRNIGRNRKHAKQLTFKRGSNQSNKSSSNWPKNK